MLFMVIERFKPGAISAVYRRFREKGRMLPEGLTYLDSWVDTGAAGCFQLMECEDARLVDRWIQEWQDLADFEVVPVVTSKAAAESFVSP